MNPEDIAITSETNVRSAPGFAALMTALEAAVPLLRDFWPIEPEHGTYNIHVVPGWGANTKYFKNSGQAPRQSILVGVDFLSQGPGFTLSSKLKFSDLSIVVQMLGHETFHLAQNERIRLSGGKQGWMKSGFALGLQPSMSPKWKAAAFDLASIYDDRKLMFPAIAKASDIVSELLADIRGLNALQHAKMDWKAFSTALQSIRADDEAANPGNYQTADAMGMIIKDRLPSEMDCLPRLWSLAFKQLLSTTLEEGLAAKIAEAMPELHLHPFAKTTPSPME